MPLSIESVLGFVPLMQAIKDVESGVPKVLPEAFYSVRPADRVLGDRARNFRYRGNRKAARVGVYGSPPRQTALMPRSVQDIALLFTTETVNFRQEFVRLLMQWMAGVPQADEMARQEILNQAQEFKTRFDTLRVAAVHNTIATFHLYFDSDGYILPDSSGAALDVDFGLPSANSGQGDDGSGPIITASWATSSTDIPAQLNVLKKRALQTTGRPLKYAFYGANIPSYLLKNDLCKAYFSFNPGILSMFQATGRPPKDLFELEWIPVYTAFNEAAASTAIVEPFPADQVTFAPEVAPDTWGMMEGSYLVPTSYQPEPTIDAALTGGLKLVYGLFEYAEVKPLNLPNSSLTAGDTFLPWPKLPEAYWKLDVTP